MGGSWQWRANCSVETQRRLDLGHTDLGVKEIGSKRVPHSAFQSLVDFFFYSVMKSVLYEQVS